MPEDINRGTDPAKYGFRPAHQVFDDGSGNFRWVGRGTWVVEYSFLPIPGTNRHEETPNYKVYVNDPIGFPEGREPWTVANRCINPNRACLNLEEAMQMARDHEARCLPANTPRAWLHPDRITEALPDLDTDVSP